MTETNNTCTFPLEFHTIWYLYNVVGIFVRLILKNAGPPLQNLGVFRELAELALKVSPSMGSKMYGFSKENQGFRRDLT